MFLAGNETFLKDIIASVGPVGVIFCLEQSFHDYQGGVYEPPNPEKCCEMKENMHGPIIVGYGSDPKVFI
jgi:Papain family cysteine protease